MRYKEGDRIAIRKDLKTSNEGAMVAPQMLQFAGETLTIEKKTNSYGREFSVLDAYNVKETDYVCDDSMIDHEATAKLNFESATFSPTIKDSRNCSHADICKRLTDMYNQKNADYGSSFTHTRSIIPNAILVRLNDKISRLNTLLTSDTQKVKSESIDDTLMDLANYCIMELMEREMENE